jgi:uncharacterized caspase-like protein
MKRLSARLYIETFCLTLTALLCAIMPACIPAAAQQNRGMQPVQPEGGQRLALVIGNANYPWKPLVNPINDATDVAAALGHVGFNGGHVNPVTNLKEREMKRAVREFVESIRPGDFAFVYYSGHGVEVNGTNYLLPIDIPADATEGEVEDEAIPAQRIARDLESQGAAVKVLVLDACRDNPIRANRSAGGGLVPMEGLGSLVIFATEAGRTASDNIEGRNGLFTQYLLKALSMKGVPLDDAVRDAARQMAADTNRRQVPAIYGLLEKPVFLVNGPVTMNVVPAEPVLDPAVEAWNLIKTSRDPEVFESFARTFPNSDLTASARLRAQQLRSEAAEASVHASPIPPATSDTNNQPNRTTNLRTKSESSLITAGGQQMQPYTSTEGRFTVTFPGGSPKLDTQTVNLKGGGTSTLYEFWTELENNNVSYMMMYNDYSAEYVKGDPQATLATTRDGAVNGKKLLSDMAISLNGVPGREFTAKDDTWNYTVRQFLHGKRLYQLIIVSSDAHPATQTSAFLDSFRIN